MKQISTSIFSRVLLITIGVFLLSIFLVSFAPAAHAADPIYKVLTPTANCTSVVGAVSPAEHCFSGMGAITVRIWYTIMTVVNSMVLAMLIWVAFMNILRIQMDSYAVKKILPTFIIAIILANFSFLLARMLLDVANIAISAFLTGSGSNGVTGAFNTLINDQLYGPSAGGAANGTTNGQPITSYAGYISVYIVKQIVLGVAAVMIAILAFIFLIRNYFIYFLICIAPAAFMSLVLPITKKYFQQWFAQFLKWIFMPVISVFWLWLAGEFIGAISTNGTWVLPVGFAGLCLYMAITSPFKAGGAAVGAWGNLGKKAWNKTAGAAWNATGGAGVKSAKGWVGDKYMNVKRSGINLAKDKLPIVKQWSRSAARGRLRQDVINSSFEDKDKERQQQALVDFMRTGEFKRGGGFKNKTFKKLKGQVKKLFLDDEYDAETYKSHPTSMLVGNVALLRGAARKADGSIDLEKTVNVGGAQHRVASQVDIAQKHGKEKFYNYYGDEIKTSGPDGKSAIDMMKETAAATKQLKLTANNTAANTRSAATDRPGLGRKIDFYRDELRLQGTDPRTMTSSAVPGEGMGDEDETGGESADEVIDEYTGTRARLARGRQNAGLGPTASGAGNQSSGVPGAGQHLADMSRLEELMHEQNDLLRKMGEKSEDTNKAMAEAAKPTVSVGAGIAHIPELEVRIKSIDPMAGEQLRLLQTRVQKAGSAQAIRMAQQQETTLESVASILKHGQNPAEVKDLVSQGREKMAAGDFEGAKQIALKISPEAEQAVSLAQGQGAAPTTGEPTK